MEKKEHSRSHNEWQSNDYTQLSNNGLLNLVVNLVVVLAFIKYHKL